MSNKGERGERGEKGEQGEKGVSHLAPGVAKAIAYIVALNLLLFFLTFVWLTHIQDVNHKAQLAQQAAQRKASLVIEKKLCSTFAKLAANQPPPGNPLTNPSRQYDQKNHAILSQVAPDLNCSEIDK